MKKAISPSRRRRSPWRRCRSRRQPRPPEASSSCRWRTWPRPERFNPQRVKVPGVCVDYVVVATKPQMQTMGTQFKPALAGDIKVPEATIDPMPFDERKIIARRAAMELIPGPINLGIGIPQGSPT